MYLKGDGVRQDTQQALALVAEASAAGCAEAAPVLAALCAMARSAGPPPGPPGPPPPACLAGQPPGAPPGWRVLEEDTAGEGPAAFAAGAAVRLAGLQRAELNGRRGVVRIPRLESGRVGVELQGEVKAIKPENLELV